MPKRKDALQFVLFSPFGKTQQCAAMLKVENMPTLEPTSDSGAAEHSLRFTITPSRSREGHSFTVKGFAPYLRKRHITTQKVKVGRVKEIVYSMIRQKTLSFFLTQTDKVRAQFQVKNVEKSL